MDPAAPGAWRGAGAPAGVRARRRTLAPPIRQLADRTWPRRPVSASRPFRVYGLGFPARIRQLAAGDGTRIDQ
ncbi:hypothetical protein PGTUg99_003280 [Puccinia graminis f. sp. tritici]|uniref:Uncharacterized protein n=1 Tax=Puccinia graminis f. sp. tritici TaxID=56615 RepID=A0A5B0RJ75_PUCGR|nr:hypothetical protein PGTUg99_002496 [Puccinia graminis f. sp. tritici]KAA1124983.1 hypothetical protein PGTUg99_003280 [Puccinia graminis f. sp. tritici]